MNLVMATSNKFGSKDLLTTPSTENRKSQTSYKTKVRPIVRVEGSKEGQFNQPWGLAVDLISDNIFIADQHNHKVQVFSREGKYLFKFGGGGECVMDYPNSIAIYKERIFVSQDGRGSILMFDLNGHFITQFNTIQTIEGQCTSIFGIAISEIYEAIYLCDTFNDRVLIQLYDYPFSSQITNIATPIQVQLTEEYIYILTFDYTSIIAFDYNLTPINTVLCKQVVNTFGFCIDGTGNFVISDFNKNAILIYDKDNNLLHKISNNSMVSPIGVAIDSQRRVFVVSSNGLFVF